MFNFNWSEIILILVIALIVIGPKDIPKIMKFLGYWVAKLRQMIRGLKLAWYSYADKLELDRLNDVSIKDLPSREEIIVRSKKEEKK
jgi:sec-independent protein translocase protein TatB